MGEAFTAISDDANAMFYNPAGMGMHFGAHGTLMLVSLYGSATYGCGALVIPVSSRPQIGIGLAGGYLSTSDTIRDRYGNVTGKFQIYDALGALGIGWRASSYLSFGAVGKFVASKIHNYHAYSLLGDFGLMVNPTKYLYFGLSLQHLGTPRRFINDFELAPTTIKGGLALKFPFGKSHLLLSSDLMWPINDLPVLALGGEFKLYLKPKDNVGTSGFIVHAGYRSGYHLGEWGGTSFGLGYEYEVWEAFHITLEAVYLSYGFLGNSEYLSFSASFAPF